MKKVILKTTTGRFFTTEDGQHTTTSNLEKATQFMPDKGALMVSALNRDSNLTYTAVPYAKEVLIYYPHCAYHASDQLDADKYVRKINLGEANGQYTAGKAVCIEGLWFVHARKDAVPA